MNKVILMGRLTRDPEVRYAQGENAMAIARFSLAVNKRFKRQGESDADFIHKLEIALKESSETEYWLELLYLKGKLPEESYKPLLRQCGSLRRRLIASVTTSKNRSRTEQ